MAKFAVIILSLICFLISETATRSVNPVGGEGGDLRNVKISVASVNGKNYYANPFYGGTWEEGAAFCKLYGGHLATITTQEEYNSLKGVNEAVISYRNYWTAARDSKLPRQLSWNLTEEQPSGDFIDWQDHYYGSFGNKYLTCGYISLQEEDTYMGIWNCASSHFFPLCEM